MSSSPRRTGGPDRTGVCFWLGVWFPVALGVAVIALESTVMMGADHTSGPLRWLFQSIFGPVQDDRWDLIHHIVRKSGHFIGYGLLGLTWLRAWWFTLPRSRYLQNALLALAGTALVASLDEWHQTYLPNRTGSPWDVLLDCCGAVTLLILVYLFLRIFQPKRLARAE